MYKKLYYQIKYLYKYCLHSLTFLLRSGLSNKLQFQIVSLLILYTIHIKITCTILFYNFLRFFKIVDLNISLL